MRVRRAALPLLKLRGGAIVNVASVAAFNSSPQSVSYAASKAPVVSCTRSLAYGHGVDGIRANGVAPGWVRTPMSEYEMQLAAGKNGTTVESEFESVEGRIALGRGIVRDRRRSRRWRRRPVADAEPRYLTRYSSRLGRWCSHDFFAAGEVPLGAANLRSLAEAAELRSPREGVMLTV
jgi:NAD(P)-dependent dehydrogenase (short-subunit alcohol dehydrogenase family)